MPVDVGRARRLFTGAVRIALDLRDGGCAFPGCEQPTHHCEGHHIIPWWLGGETNLDNGVLLCRYHHTLVEPDPDAPQGAMWEVRLDRHSRPEFLPPTVYDLSRTPRQHARFQLH